jgi:hypothetical protein
MQIGDAQYATTIDRHHYERFELHFGPLYGFIDATSEKRAGNVHEPAARDRHRAVFQRLA